MWQGTVPSSQDNNSRAQSLEYLNLEGRLANVNLGGTTGGARPKTGLLTRYDPLDLDLDLGVCVHGLDDVVAVLLSNIIIRCLLSFHHEL